MRTSDSNTVGRHRDVIRPAYTPDKISSLKSDEVFVFGSNLAGMHGGGAARVARIRFGAVCGQGVGLQGQSYAIPTMQGGVETIRPYVDDFISFAMEHRELFFYVTRIGCGIAGFKDEEIAPLFAAAIDLDNVCLPKSFATIIQNDRESHKVILTHAYGITRTFADIVIARNKTKKFKSADEVKESLRAYFDQFVKDGDPVAFFAVRAFWDVLYEEGIFTNGRLDVARFRALMFSHDSLSEEYDQAYVRHCMEMICNVVVFLNEFRRYSNPMDIKNDLNKSGLMNFSHCGPHSKHYLMSPMSAMIPRNLFERGIKENWDYLAPKGTLDADRLNELMFNKHERGLRKYGLKAVIVHDYAPTGCLGGAYIPKTIGSGPFYAENKDGQLLRSCGDGTLWFYKYPNVLEINIAFKVLNDDSRYACDGPYMIPKFDMTLPILQEYVGILSFKSDEEKKRFIVKHLGRRCC
jgi:hypothetical protein